jgi:hypothetical protein
MVLFFALLGLAIALYESSQHLFGDETRKMFQWLRVGAWRKREDNHDR